MVEGLYMKEAIRVIFQSDILEKPGSIRESGGGGTPPR